MKLGKTLFLLLVLAALIVIVPLLFLGYIPLPPQEALGNGNEHYLKVKTDPSGVADIPGEGWYERYTNVTLNAPELVDISKGARYRFAYWDVDSVSQGMDENPISVHMDCHHTATAHYVVQYYLIMFTNYGTVTPGDGWHDSGSEVTINAFAPTTVPGERYFWIGWSGIGEGNYTGSDKEASITMNSPINETASWTHQYYLIVISPYGITEGEGWYDSDSTAYATLDIDTVDHGNGTRRLFTSWSGDATGTNYEQSNSIIMNEPKNVVAIWKTQYLLTITAGPGGTTDPSGSQWHDSESTVLVTAIPDTNYVFDHWELDGENAGTNNSFEVFMDTTHTLHATFIYSPPPPTQYYLTVSTNPPNIVSIAGEGWYNEGEIVSLDAPLYIEISADTWYRFDHWDIDGDSQVANDSQIDVEMTTNHTATAHYEPSIHIVGGTTISIKNPLDHTWIVLETLILTAIFSISALLKKKQR